VQGWLAASQIVIVHGRQIVMYEREGMYEFDRGRWHIQFPRVDAKAFAGVQPVRRLIAPRQCLFEAGKDAVHIGPRFVCEVHRDDRTFREL